MTNTWTANNTPLTLGERAGEPEFGLQSGQCADGGVFAEPDQRDQRLRSGDGDGDERGHDQRLRDHADLHD